MSRKDLFLTPGCYGKLRANDDLVIALAGIVNSPGKTVYQIMQDANLVRKPIECAHLTTALKSYNLIRRIPGRTALYSVNPVYAYAINEALRILLPEVKYV